MRPMAHVRQRSSAAAAYRRGRTVLRVGAEESLARQKKGSRRKTQSKPPSPPDPRRLGTMLATASPHVHTTARRLSVVVSPAIARVRLPRRRLGRYASLRAVASAAATEAAPPGKEGAEELGFQEMTSGTRRKYYMLGGKGGVGKTSCAASLAVRFANNGHPTLVVSTDPAHSLSDSFAQVIHHVEL